MKENLMNEKDLYVGYIPKIIPTLTIVKKEENGYTLLFINNEIISIDEIKIISKLNKFLNSYNIDTKESYTLRELEILVEKYNYELSSKFDINKKVEKIIEELTKILREHSNNEVLEIVKTNLYKYGTYKLVLNNKEYLITLETIIINSSDNLTVPYIETHIENLILKPSNR